VSERKRHRAQDRLTAWHRAQPWRSAYWRGVDKVRAAHARDWPRHTFLPLREAGQIVTAAWRTHGRQDTREALARESCTLAGLAAWRVTQGIFRYDPTLAAALVDTPLTGDLPVSALTHLPHWCVYVETPGRTMPLVSGGSTALHGCYAWINSVAAEDRIELMLGLDTDRPYPQLPVSVVPLVGTLEQSIRAVQTEWQDSYDAGLVHTAPSAALTEGAQRLSPLIALLLYLCADDAEIGDGTIRPKQPQPAKTKQGWRMFPATAPTMWDVGVRIGAAIRRAQERETSGGYLTGERSRPRAHIRRAHWATYWTGERSGQQTPVLRWLPPIPVNVECIEAMPVTIRPVLGRPEPNPETQQGRSFGLKKSKEACRDQ
jgi:hypothetical protein